MFWNPPCAATWGYLDWNVLSMLFCLMAVVAGFRKIGVFQNLADVCCKHLKSSRMLAFLLWNLCFFLSMLVTNDVALITFVPFTCSLLQRDDPNEKFCCGLLSLKQLRQILGVWQHQLEIHKIYIYIVPILFPWEHFSRQYCQLSESAILVCYFPCFSFHNNHLQRKFLQNHTCHYPHKRRTS